MSWCHLPERKSGTGHTQTVGIYQTFRRSGLPPDRHRVEFDRHGIQRGIRQCVKEGHRYACTTSEEPANFIAIISGTAPPGVACGGSVLYTLKRNLPRIIEDR